MAELIPIILDLIKRPETNKVMSTVSPEGNPHTIVCGSLLAPDPETIIVGEVYMYATIDNLRSCPKAEFLVWSGKNAYSIQTVAVARSESGPLFDRMNQNLDRMHMQAVAIWEFKVLSAYDESITDLAGTQVI